MTSELKPEFLKALLKLKAEIAPIVKNQQGYGYKYADLSEVHKAIDKPLQDNGFVLYHEFSTAEGRTFMDTHLIHEHGVLASTLPLDIEKGGKMNQYQAMGSAITYLRRYAIMALLGLPAEDDDGRTAARPANGNAEKKQPGSFWEGKNYRINVKDNDYKLWAAHYKKGMWNAPSIAALNKLEEDNRDTLEHIEAKFSGIAKDIEHVNRQKREQLVETQQAAE